MQNQNECTPEDIIGPMLLDDFQQHYRSTHKIESKEEFDKAIKKFDSGKRTEIAETYKDLRKHNFYPGGVDKHGDIKWQCRTYDRFARVPVNQRIDNEKIKNLNIEAVRRELERAMKK